MSVRSRVGVLLVVSGMVLSLPPHIGVALTLTPVAITLAVAAWQARSARRHRQDPTTVRNRRR